MLLKYHLKSSEMVHTIKRLKKPRERLAPQIDFLIRFIFPMGGKKITLLGRPGLGLYWGELRSEIIVRNFTSSRPLRAFFEASQAGLTK